MTSERPDSGQEPQLPSWYPLPDDYQPTPVPAADPGTGQTPAQSARPPAPRAPSALWPSGRRPRIGPDWVVPGRLLSIGATVLLFASMFFPWYVLADPQAFAPCQGMQGSDHQMCMEETNALGGGAGNLTNFHWWGWSGSVSWVPLLFAVAVVALIVANRVVDPQRVGFQIPPAEALALPVVVIADLFFLVAAAHMPSPGGGVAGSDAFSQGLGIWIAIPCMLVLTSGVTLMFIGSGWATRLTWGLARAQARQAAHDQRQ